MKRCYLLLAGIPLIALGIEYNDPWWLSLPLLVLGNAALMFYDAKLRP